MSNQYYMNANGSYPSVLPAYAPASEGSVSIPAPINNNYHNNNNNNNKKMAASNNGFSFKTHIPTIIAIVIAIVAIALSIVARNEAVKAREDAKNAISAFVKTPNLIPGIINNNPSASNANNNNNNNPSTTTTMIPTTTPMNTAVYAQAIYKVTGGTKSQLSVPGQWFHDDSVAPPVTIPTDGVYLVMTTCRAYLNAFDSYWMCRLNRNNDPDNSLSVTYGNKVWGNAGNGDNSVSGFWIGELSAGDVIRQQYRIDGAATTYNTYGRNEGGLGYSSIQLIRIGSSAPPPAVYAQAIYKTKGGTHGERSVPGVWLMDEAVAPPVQVPTDGTYLVLTTCRAILNNVDAYWMCRLIRNNDADNSLSVTYGGKVWGGNAGNADNSVSGFWIGKLSSGDLIRQQYMINGPSNTFNLYSPVDNGFSTIQIVRIGE